MMKVADYNLLNIGPTPKEIKRMRKEIYDFHTTLGRPVVFKHRWNLKDQKNGLCQPCPYFDQTYHRNKTDCPYCFGTGFLGGFADGVITFVTMADAPVDALRISPEGIILYEKHPQLTAPWGPDMGDGDLIITADFDRGTWQVLQTLEIFELNQVDPVTVRGIWGQYTDYKVYKLQQTAKIDRVPDNHVYYNVPIEYDYTSTIVVDPPVGTFPSDYPNPTAAIEVGLRLIGRESGNPSATSNVFNLVGAGTESSTEFNLNLVGLVNPTSNVVIFE